MILIISEVGDNITDLVISHLHAKGVDFFRINSNDQLISVQFRENNYIFEIAHKGTVSLKNVSKIWYRRGYINIPDFSPLKEVAELEETWWMVLDHALTYDNDKMIGSFTQERVQNKLLDLDLASAAGIKTPASLLTSSKKCLIEFLKLHNKVITKSIGNNTSMQEELFGCAKTLMVNNEVLSTLPENMPPVFFQEYVEKELEIRIFYLNKRIYAVAIFSQSNDRTKIDFRNNDDERPNRLVPYLLPDKIVSYIINFMELKKLYTGSIDMILTPELDYIFLEVNPCGQLEWISKACNLGLEKEIVNVIMEK